MKKAFGIIVDVLTFIVFFVLVLIILSRVKMMVSGKEYFDVFGYSIFNVATGSMEPVISQNDIIIVKEQKDYELNDIVTFKSDNAYVTHRVISKSGNSIITKGDANNAKDVSIKKDDIIGKVVHVIRQGGVWQQIFTSPTIIIMIFVTLMLFDFAFSYRGNKEANEEEDVKVKEVSSDEDEVVEKKEKKPRKKINIKEKLDEKIKVVKIKAEEVKEKAKSKRKKTSKKEEKEEEPKLTDKEIVELYKKTQEAKKTEAKAKEVKKIEETEDAYTEDEDDPFGYTVRLDLSELQKRINEKMNEDKHE